MFWKTSILAAGFGAVSLCAQTAPPIIIVPQAPTVRAKTARALRELLAPQSQQNQPAVCSIPLLNVRVQGILDPMPNLVPPDLPNEVLHIDHMPLVKLPAPPCEEGQR